MPYRKEQFANGEIYHIILRALDNNLIFKDTDDYFRGIFSIYEFNNANPVSIWLRRKQRRKEKILETLQGPSLQQSSDRRDVLVEVMAFCFMPNHIHLLAKQVKDNGIRKFMSKVGTGYAVYFNKKYQRQGHVFQNRFKSVHVENDNQFMVTASYIFTNPIALIEPGWKELGIRNHSLNEVVKFLENYKWSSYQDSIGIKNFDSVTNRTFLLEMMGSISGLKGVVKDWIEHKKNIAKYSHLFLE